LVVGQFESGLIAIHTNETGETSKYEEIIPPTIKPKNNMSVYHLEFHALGEKETMET
jgi:hypothetical protein